MEDSVDLVALLSTIWHRRRFILKSAVVGMLLGLAVALMTPNIFRATSTFVPQTLYDISHKEKYLSHYKSNSQDDIFIHDILKESKKQLHLVFIKFL